MPAVDKQNNKVGLKNRGRYYIKEKKIVDP